MTAIQKTPVIKAASEASPDHAAAPAGARRTLDLFDRLGVPCTVRTLAHHASTPEEIAAGLSCELQDLALTSVFRGKATRKPFLLIHAAATPVSDKVLSQIVGENIQRADADFIMRYAGYSPEAIPPAGHLNRLPIIMDSGLTRFPRIWVNLGVPDCFASLPTLVLARSISARIVRIIV